MDRIVLLIDARYCSLFTTFDSILSFTGIQNFKGKVKSKVVIEPQHLESMRLGSMFLLTFRR